MLSFAVKEGLLQPRILAVDDHSEVRIAVQGVLERERMHVTLAESAEAGLDALSRAHFDLVITDLRMRRKTGLDLVRETRSHGIGVPFILLTADADGTISNLAAELGVAAVLKKPVRKQLLLNHVGELLTGSGLHGLSLHGEPRQPCSAKCTFSIGGFCSFSTEDLTN